MLKFESPHSKYTGELALPEYDDFTGAMFNVYRDALERQGGTEAKFFLELGRRAAYAGAEVIKRYGKWDIEGLAVDQFLAWESDPEAENMRFVQWVGQTFADWYKIARDPNA